MPTYDYECLKCGKVIEVFQKINETRLKECPHCHGKLKRLIGTGSGLIFKGSGFYATDYRKKKTSDFNTKCDKKDSCSLSKQCGKNSK